MGAVPDASGGVVSTGSMVSDDGSGTGEVLGLGGGVVFSVPSPCCGPSEGFSVPGGESV